MFENYWKENEELFNEFKIKKSIAKLIWKAGENYGFDKMKAKSIEILLNKLK